MKTIKIISLLFSIFFLFLGCNQVNEPTNNSPIIQTFYSSPSSTNPNGLVNLSCVTTDSDGDNLSYSWSADYGVFPNGSSGSTVIWKAPVEEGTYKIKVSVEDGSVSKVEEISVESINRIPNSPMYPSPTDGIIDNPINTILSWTSTDPDKEELTYDIFIGTNSDSLTLISSANDTTYNLGSLEYNVTYYWKVVAKDNNGGIAEGLVWHFTNENKACPGIPTVTYSGKTYNTVEIGDQCWLKENLDVGSIIKGTTDRPNYTLIDNQTNNGIIEKYCYDNIEENCEKYGGLYQWEEAMQYTTNEGTQGICPSGWHIPTEAEFNLLADAAGGRFESLVAISEGYSRLTPTNTTGFTALMGGWLDGHEFMYYNTMFFSSSGLLSNGGIVLNRSGDNRIGVDQYSTGWKKAVSVRCLMN